MTLELRENEPLAGRTTIGVGGPARWFACATGLPALREALAFARAEALPVFVLGEGSNVVVADAGFPGLALRLGDTDVAVVDEGPDGVTVRAGGGAVWDDLVGWAVARDLAGIECLSGIPGLVGAAPIQNIGAYGQEVADVVTAVTVVDRASGAVRVVPAADCGFGYRTSRFKGPAGDPVVVTGLELRLRRGGAPTLRYAQLAGRVAATCAGEAPTLARVREVVLAIRREKGMVVDAADPDSRSAGSFFVNPVVAEAVADAVAARVRARGGDAATMPRHPAGPGRVKLSAAWLIERAGFRRGHAKGRAGLSNRHVLALVNRGGATAAEIRALADEVRAGVAAAFAVALVPEPVFVGFADG